MNKPVELRKIGKRVVGQGPVPCDIMVIGQNPGREEANRGLPFVGESGSELDKLYLPLAGLRRSDVYVDNLYRWRTPDNKDLNAAEIGFGMDELYATVDMVKPKFIILLGAQVTEAVLGTVDFDYVHGRPDYNALLTNAVIIPAYHPAAGIHKPRTMNFIMQDWRDIGRIIRGEAVYHDYNMKLTQRVIGVDTETVDGRLWSIQITTTDGRTTMHFADNFKDMIDAHMLIEWSELVVYHNAVFDHAMLTSVGIKPQRYTDTMQMLYLLGNQHQKLKVAAKRYFNVDMTSYDELLLPYNNAKAVAYLARIANDITTDAAVFPTKKAAVAFVKTLSLVIAAEYEKQEAGHWIAELEISNFNNPDPMMKSTGMTEVITQPTNVVTLVRRALQRHAADSSVDLRAWWAGCDSKYAAVAKFGEMPEATIADVKREDAVAYACKDAEVTLRLWHVLEPVIQAEGLGYALAIDMEIVPLINQMEANGLLMDKDKLCGLLVELQYRADTMLEVLQMFLFAEGFLKDAEVFNPSSSDQVMSYLKFRHFNTKNTEAKYLEPLAQHDEGIRMLLEYRKLMKLTSTYVDNLLYEAEKSHDGRVRSHFNLNIADTGRLTSSNPVNWQNIPAHTEDGGRIREAVIPAEGNVFVSLDFCLSGETGVITADGIKHIKDIKVGDYILSSADGKSLCFKPVTAVGSPGVRHVFRMTLEDGTSVVCTQDHKWMRYDGTMSVLAAISIGDRLAHVKSGYSGKHPTWYIRSNRNYAKKHRLVASSLLGELPEGCQTDHIDGDTENWKISNLRYLSAGENLAQGGQRYWKAVKDGSRSDDKRLGELRYALKYKRASYEGKGNPNYGKRKGRTITCKTCGTEFYKAPCYKAAYCSVKCYNVFRNGNHKLSNIEHLGKEKVYCITVEDTHTFVLENGLISGNSQIEIRVMAHTSQDSRLLKMLVNKEDIHSEVSMWLFNDAVKAHRTASKKTSFGIPYGISGAGLLDQFQAEGLTGWTVEKCDALINKWFGLFPGVRAMMEAFHLEAISTGKVRDMFGRYRLIPEAKSSLPKVKSSGLRNAGNAPIQSGAQAVIKKAMADAADIIDDYARRHTCLLVNQIHDELLFEVSEDIWLEFAAVIKTVMENAVKLTVPVVVSVEVGRNWRDMEEIEL